jgi:ketosteroid isomerase-like protein
MLAIENLLSTWAEAERRGDAETLRGLLVDDFVGIGPFGFTLTKDQWLERYASRELVHEAFALEEVAVRHYGDAAVAVGVQDQQTTWRGQPASGRFRAGLVLVRSDDAWALAGVQLSLMGPPPGVTPPGRAA